MKKKKTNLNKTGRIFPSKKRIEDREHLMYVCSLPCFISRAGYMSCQGYKFLKHYGFKEDAAQKYAKELYERGQIDSDLPF